MSLAGVAHPVERHLAKVEVASSSLVTRSKKDQPMAGLFFLAEDSRGENHQMQQSGGLLPASGWTEAAHLLVFRRNTNASEPRHQLEESTHQCGFHFYGLMAVEARKIKFNQPVAG